MIAQNAIRDILNDNQPVPVTVERIISEVGRIIRHLAAGHPFKQAQRADISGPSDFYLYRP